MGTKSSIADSELSSRSFDSKPSQRQITLIADKTSKITRVPTEINQSAVPLLQPSGEVPYQSLHTPDRGSLPTKFPATTTEAAYPPGSLTAETSQTNYPGLNHGSPTKEAKNRIDLPSVPFDRPRRRRVEERPDYRIRKTRERGPSKKPAKPLTPTPRDIYDELRPQFVQFICEWEGCQAKLDNFTKLEKHLGTVHGDDALGNRQCKWGRCGQVINDGEGGRTAVVFASVEELEDHTYSRHLGPLVWHMGDGRAGKGIIIKDLPRKHATYLLYDGVQVTPSVHGQKVESVAELRKRKRRLEKLISQRDANAPTDTERETETEDSGEEK